MEDKVNGVTRVLLMLILFLSLPLMFNIFEFDRINPLVLSINPEGGLSIIKLGLLS